MSIKQIQPPFCDEYEASEDRSRRSRRLSAAQGELSSAYILLEILEKADEADISTRGEIKIREALIVVREAMKHIKAGRKNLKKYDKKQSEWEIAPYRKARSTEEETEAGDAS